MMSNDSSLNVLLLWEPRVIDWVRQQMSQADSGHDLEHVRRVVQNARSICEVESGNIAIVVLAAWMHDSVCVPKNSPQRSMASKLAANAAQQFLLESGFPSHLIEPICHCIEAHSFSAGVQCESLEAKIVQDADRLEALGAIGIARCLMTGGSLNMRLYEPAEPFPIQRKIDDSRQSIDHFFAKLLGLAQTMQTEHGKRIAMQRTEFLKTFLRQLAEELGVQADRLEPAFK